MLHEGGAGGAPVVVAPRPVWWVGPGADVDPIEVPRNLPIHLQLVCEDFPLDRLQEWVVQVWVARGALQPLKASEGRPGQEPAPRCGRAPASAPGCNSRADVAAG